MMLTIMMTMMTEDDGDDDVEHEENDSDSAMLLSFSRFQCQNKTGDENSAVDAIGKAARVCC